MTDRIQVTAVAIPARDEADRIVGCLDALQGQIGARLDHIVLLVNNSRDATASRARAAAGQLGTAVHVIETVLPPEQANAGHARRLAMAHAARLVGADGVLLTTDADGQVDPDWLAANLAAIRDGADLVAGWVELDPVEWGRIPMRLHRDDARECAYDMLCDEIHARLDPDPADPLPRHTQHSGASLAVTAAAYERCGGVPAIPCGEDRALVDALRRVDARIRHALEVHVTVSGRTEGRSPGGMADTIRRRLARAGHLPRRAAGAGGRLRAPRAVPGLDCARRLDDRCHDLAPLAEALQLPAAQAAHCCCGPGTSARHGRRWRKRPRRCTASRCALPR